MVLSGPKRAEPSQASHASRSPGAGSVHPGELAGLATAANGTAHALAAIGALGAGFEEIKFCANS